MPRRKKAKNYHSFLIIIATGVLLAVAVILANMTWLSRYFKTNLPGYTNYSAVNLPVTIESLTATTANIKWMTAVDAWTNIYVGTASPPKILIGVTPSKTPTTSHAMKFQNLNPNTQYFFFVQANYSLNSLTQTENSSEYNFTTSSVQETTIPAKATASLTSATITWNTIMPADSTVFYRPTNTSAYQPVVDNNLVTAHTVQLMNLTSGTPYEFHVRSEDATKSFIFHSLVTPPQTFTTLKPDTTPPAIGVIYVTTITSTMATIIWSTNEDATSEVEYGTSTSYGQKKINTAALTGAHVVALSSLTPKTLYHYRVISSDAAGNLVVSGDETFTTL